MYNFLKACLYQRLWLSSKHARKGAGSSRERNNTIYFLLCMRKFLFFFPLSLCLSLPSYQWRWAWEQKQRSSGTVSGSCRLNALGCCGWSGIRGRGETWTNQRTSRTQAVIKHPNPRGRQERKRRVQRTNTTQHCNWVREETPRRKRRSVDSISGLSVKVMHGSDLGLAWKHMTGMQKLCQKRERLLNWGWFGEDAKRKLQHYASRSQKWICFKPGIGKLRPRSHMQPLELFILALQTWRNQNKSKSQACHK